MNDLEEAPPSMPLQWRFYVEDTIGFCENVLEFTAGLDLEGFVADRLTHYAMMHDIVLIGEAATHIPDEIRNARPDIPLGKIIGARNRIIHGYLTVDDDIVWDIIQRAIPSLLPRLRESLETA